MTLEEAKEDLSKLPSYIGSYMDWYRSGEKRILIDGEFTITELLKLVYLLDNFPELFDAT